MQQPDDPFIDREPSESSILNDPPDSHRFTDAATIQGLRTVSEHFQNLDSFGGIFPHEATVAPHAGPFYQSDSSHSSSSENPTFMTSRRTTTMPFSLAFLSNQTTARPAHLDGYVGREIVLTDIHNAQFDTWPRFEWGMITQPNLEDPSWHPPPYTALDASCTFYVHLKYVLGDLSSTVIAKYWRLNFDQNAQIRTSVSTFGPAPKITDNERQNAYYIVIARKASLMGQEVAGPDKTSASQKEASKADKDRSFYSFGWKAVPKNLWPTNANDLNSMFWIAVGSTEGSKRLAFFLFPAQQRWYIVLKWIKTNCPIFWCPDLTADESSQMGQLPEIDYSDKVNPVWAATPGHTRQKGKKVDTAKQTTPSVGGQATSPAGGQATSPTGGQATSSGTDTVKVQPTIEPRPLLPPLSTMMNTPYGAGGLLTRPTTSYETNVPPTVPTVGPNWPYENKKPYTSPSQSVVEYDNSSWTAINKGRQTGSEIGGQPTFSPAARPYGTNYPSTTPAMQMGNQPANTPHVLPSGTPSIATITTPKHDHSQVGGSDESLQVKRVKLSQVQPAAIDKETQTEMMRLQLAGYQTEMMDQATLGRALDELRRERHDHLIAARRIHQQIQTLKQEQPSDRAHERATHALDYYQAKQLPLMAKTTAESINKLEASRFIRIATPEYKYFFDNEASAANPPPTPIKEQSPADDRLDISD